MYIHTYTHIYGIYRTYVKLRSRYLKFCVTGKIIFSYRAKDFQLLKESSILNYNQNFSLKSKSKLPEILWVSFLLRFSAV